MKTDAEPEVKKSAINPQEQAKSHTANHAKITVAP